MKNELVENIVNFRPLEEKTTFESSVKADKIPQELKSYNQWVMWRYENNEGKKPKKIPYSITGRKANVSDSSTWSSFEEVLKIFSTSSNKYSGIGFVFSEDDPFVGIDWDGVRDSGNGYWDYEVLNEIKALETYAEVSPSGTGAHAIIKGKKDPMGNNRYGNREIYDNKRYFTVTGNTIVGVPFDINNTNEAFDLIQEKVGYKQSNLSSLENGSVSIIEDEEADVISKCKTAANREKFNDLLDGNWQQYYTSQSQADIALCGMLACHTKNEKQIDSIFRKSGLYREDKWERDDYPINTIRNAIEYVNSRNSWNGIELPPGYKIDENGLHYLGAKKPICRTPIVLSAIGNDIDTGEFWYRITFKDPCGRIQETYTKQEQLIKKSELLKLANKGILVTDKKGADMCEYFVDSIHSIASDLAYVIFVQKNGWKNNNEMFVLGNRYYSTDAVGSVVHVEEDTAKGLVQAGTLEDWVNGIGGIIAEPITRFKCYCVASSMLLGPLGVQSYLVDHTCGSSTGKTLSTKVPFSMYGNPEDLILSGKSTPTYLEHMASKYTDFALFVDETSLQSPEVLKELIYMLANGVGKGRGKKDGGVRKQNHWNTVAFTTGEKPITDVDGFVGQQVRVIEIQRELPKMYDAVEAAEETLLENYGHVGDKFIRKVFNKKDELHSRFVHYKEIFKNNEVATMNRAGSYFAAIAVAGELLEEVFGEIGLEVQNHLDLVEEIFNETVKDKPLVPYPVKVLRAVNGWFEENRGYFIVNEDVNSYNNSKKHGWIKNGEYIDIITSTLKNAMSMKDLDIASVVDSWIKDGIIVCSGKRKSFQARHLDGNGGNTRTDVYRFNIKTMEKYLE